MSTSSTLQTVGERIRAKRLALSLSQTALADKIGSSQSVISELESGLVSPNLSLLTRIAEALGVKVKYFFTST